METANPAYIGWNLGWDEDISLSDVEWKDEDQNIVQQLDCYELYLDEPKKLQEESGVSHFLNENFRLKHCNSGISFAYIHDQDMNYYQEPTSYYHGNYGRDSEDRAYTQTSMLGNIPEPSKENDLDYDPEYDKEVNKLLEEVEEELLVESSVQPKDEIIVKADKDQYEDFYDEFAPEEPAREIPQWYLKNLQQKQQVATERLKSLSLLVGYASPRAWEHMKRIEQDHHTPFCKINPPRHPPVDKPWKNLWRFKCVTKCKEDPPEPNHAHTADCEEILLEHDITMVSIKSKNLMLMEFPKHIMLTVELFQNFINATAKDNPYLYSDEVPDTVYEKPSWNEIRLRTNYKNEILMHVTGKAVTPLIEPLKRLFKYGAGRTLNVTSLWCTNIRWSQKKGPKAHPTHVYGVFDLRDKIGPITIRYNPYHKILLNSAEAEQLGRIMMEYLSPTAETTVIDIGCSVGALSLMLATKCDKVIGLSTQDSDIKFAEEMQKSNALHNATFINCAPKDLHTKCASLVKKCISVAVLNLATPFGKSPDVMKSLRNLPSLWRVALYGTFTKEYQKHITILTSSDCHLGDEFLPMQACILEKSPSIPNEFSIVVIFERKSLLEPSLELIGCGPTVNIKEDSDLKTMKPLKIPDVKTSVIVGKGYGKFRQYDSPALPKDCTDTDVKPVVVPPPSEEDNVTSVLPPDYGKPAKKPPPIDIAKLYDPTPNPKLNKQLKKVYDSPLLPKSNNSSNTESMKSNSSAFPKSSIEAIPSTSSTISTDPRCDFLSELKPSLPISTDPRCDFLSELKPSLPISNDSRCGFRSESKPSLPISTDPRCDFLEEAISYNVKQEPFDQKKVPVRRKERNHVGPTKLKKDNRFDCPSIKKEKQTFSYSSSSQDTNSRSPPPMKTEPRIDARTPPTTIGRAFDIPSTFKTETVNSTVLPVTRETRFNSPPLPDSLPPEYSARPPEYISPPANFSLPPPGFIVPPLGLHVQPPGFPVRPPGFPVQPPGFPVQAPGFPVQTPGFFVPLPGFSVSPPLSKPENLCPLIKKAEGELSPDSTCNKLPIQNFAASNNPDVVLDANIKPEPMDLDDDNEEENLPEEQATSTALSSTIVKSEEVIPKQESTQTFPAVRIKSEPIDLSELPGHINEPPNSTELLDSTEYPVRIKTEPIDRDETVTTTMMPSPISIKPEKLSPIIDTEEFMNMPTPVHNPAALAERDRDSVSSPPASANFKTIDGFEFSVQPNQSYLVGMASTSVKKEPELEEGELEDQDVTFNSKPPQADAVAVVKREKSIEKLEEKPPVIKVKKLDTISDTCNKEDNDISIIAEKKNKSKKVKKEKSRSKSRSDRKNKKESKKKRDSDIDLDMRQLIDEKKKLQKILKQQNCGYDRSPSPSPDGRRRFESPSTRWEDGRSPPVAYKRTNRPSLSRSERWSRHPSSPSNRYSSPSSTSERLSRRSRVSPSPSRRCRRSPSTSIERQFRRSPSPSNSRRFKRSPISPSDRRFRRSPISPSDRRFRRSPISPSGRRFKRSPISPNGRRFKRSPISPSDRRFKRSPISPSDRRFKRSPISPSDRGFTRSSVSPPGDKRFRRSSPSPSVRQLERSSPSPSSRQSKHSSSSSSSRQSKHSSPSPTNRQSKRSPSVYKWTRSSPVSFGEVNTMLERETRSPSVTKSYHAALGDYENGTYRTTLSPSFDFKKRKSPPLEGSESSELKKKKSEGLGGDHWDIPTQADFSSVPDNIASSPNNRNLTILNVESTS